MYIMSQPAERRQVHPTSLRATIGSHAARRESGKGSVWELAPPLLGLAVVPRAAQEALC